MSSTTDAARPSAAGARAPWRAWVILAAILLLGGYFRTLNLTGWDGTSDLHPDERFITYTVLNLRVPPTFGEYLRSDCFVGGTIPAARNPGDPPDRLEPSPDSGCNTLNPRNYNWSRLFVYGTLPTSLARVVVEQIQQFQPEDERDVSVSDVRTTGRSLSTLFDLGSIVLVFLLGRRLYGERVGLLAAALLACAALPIQLAHFFTVDAATGFFVLLSAYWAVRAMHGGGAGVFAALGLSIGAAMACRFTMATLGLLAMVAVAARLWGDEGQSARAEERATRAGWWSAALRLGLLLFLAGGLSILTFRLLQPDAFVGTSFADIRPEPRFIDNIETVSGLVSGEQDFPPSQQWASRTPFLFSWQNMVVWGMGLPLGLAAWAGWAAAGWQLLRRRRLAHAIPWIWVAFYFAWQGGQFVMTMRYYALLYGLLAIFAAWGLTALVERTKDQEPSAARRAASGSRFWALGSQALLVFVVGFTALWAFAFTRIYTEPHSRIQASRWIYQNIPPGSAITHEEWDDPLPLNIDGNDSGRYVGIRMSPYWEDDPIKYFGYVDGNGEYQPGLLDQLDQADYLIYSSNRVYDSTSRLGMRYPALTRYYHHLFSGELGFTLVADVHSYPRLFGVELPSPILAEEAFSVYDHPRVLIFQKDASYTRANAERLITGDVAWGEVYKLPTLKASKVPTALRLTDDQWPAYRAAGTWAALFPGGGLAALAPWLVWLLAIEALGMACFALLFRLLPGLADRGFALSKTLGLLLVAYGAWLLASVGPNASRGAPLVAFGPGAVWLWTVVLLSLGGLAGWLGRAELLRFWRRRRLALLSAEGLFLAVFALFVALRAINPDLWHPARGGEKPMDLAFLTAVLKSPAFPPYDPWFAGGYLNYYYFGFVMVGALVHLTGVAPGTAYNLAVPTIVALTALGAWGAAYNLVAPAGPTKDEGQRTKGIAGGAAAVRPSSSVFGPSRRRRDRMAVAAGVAAALLAVLAGNLANARWMLPGSADLADPGIPAECRAAASYAAQNECRGRAEWAFWDATRIVAIETGDGTINEFPFFTFLYGDLHAHMIALPLTLAALGLILALIRTRRRAPWAAARRADSWLAALGAWLWPLILLGLVAGALRATNTWDYPTALGLGVLGVALAAWGRHRRGLPWQTALTAGAAGAALLVGLSAALWLPFTRAFATDYAGFELWTGGRTPAAEFLIINGMWLFLGVSAGLFLAVRTWRLRRIYGLAIGAALLVAALLSAAAGMDSLPLQGLLLLLALLLLSDLALATPAGPRSAEPRRGPRTPLDAGSPVQLVLPLEEPQLPPRPAPSRPAAAGLTTLAALWGACALGITALTEVVVAKGDIGRMNTVFKFGMQSWLLFAVVGGVALVWLWQTLAARRGAPDDRWDTVTSDAGASRAPAAVPPWAPALPWLWRAPAALLVLGALAYPLTATPARLADRFDTSIGPTLDGEAFMRSEKASWGENGQNFTLAQDADAIAWVRANVTGTPVILEAHAEAYRWAGRYSIYTGLPTLLGWPWHMTQQRAVADGGTIVANRQNLVRQLYDGIDPDATLKDLRLYGVEYVVVGQLERALYSPAGLAKFDELAQRGAIATVYSQADTRIYQVPPPDGAPAIVQSTLSVVPPTTPGKSLMLTVPADMLPAVDEYAWNALADNQLVATLLWLVAWYGLLALGLPLAALVFGGGSAARSWSDGGFAWARLIGLLLLGYAVWLPVSARLWQYDRWGLLIGIVLVLLLNGAILWRGGLEPIYRHLAAHRRAILQTEALFLLAFAVMVALRALNPDLWQPIWGGEKPFEFGFLNAMLRTPVMPPYNPYYSGGVINYYYYGFFLVSLPVKLTGIAPAVAFNLIVPTLFGLLIAGAFALVARIGGSARLGLLGALLVGVAGNLSGAFDASWIARGGLAVVVDALREGPAGFGERLGDWFIGASRVVPFTINEFPAFTFLFADLHPHMIALPITLLAVALAARLFDRRPGTTDHGPKMEDEGPWAAFGPWSSAVGLYALAALVLGTLAVTNSWDFPTYGLLLGGALLGRAWRAPAASGWQRAADMIGAAATGLLLGGAALLLFAPFFQNYQAPVTGIGMVTAPSSVSDYFLLFGLFLAALVPAVLGAAWRLVRSAERGQRAALPGAVGFVAGMPGAPSAGGLRALLLALSALVVLIAVFQTILRALGVALTDAAALAASVLGLRLWLAALIAVGVGVLLSRRIAARAWLTVWLAVVAWVVSLLFELIYVRDHLQGGDFYRMNTVFKFGLQAWVLLAIAAALALPRLWRALARIGPAAQGAYGAVLAGLLALALIYPLAATPSRVALRFPANPGPTLDGLAFLETAAFAPPAYADSDTDPGAQIVLRDEGEAIRWLNENLRGTPVVLQSSLEFYRAYGTRVAANTGFPTIVSPLHESEQRDGTLVSQRDRDVAAIFGTTDESEALRLLSRYRVSYVYLGQIERNAYGEAGAQKWDALTQPSQGRPAYLTLAFANQLVRIYAVSEEVWRLAPLPQADAVEPVIPRPTPAPDATVQNPLPSEPPPAEEAPAADLAGLEAQVLADPTKAGPAFELARRYWQSGRLDEAAAVLAIAAQSNPGDIGLHHLWGDILLEAGRVDEAEVALRAAIVAQPTASNWNKLGVALLTAGRNDGAEDAFLQALAVDPAAAEPHLRLGQLYERTQRAQQAAESYRRYLELDPGGPYAVDAQDGLARVAP